MNKFEIFETHPEMNEPSNYEVLALSEAITQLIDAKRIHWNKSSTGQICFEHRDPGVGKTIGFNYYADDYLQYKIYKKTQLKYKKKLILTTTFECITQQPNRPIWLVKKMFNKEIEKRGLFPPVTDYIKNGTSGLIPYYKDQAKMKRKYKSIYDSFAI